MKIQLRNFFKFAENLKKIPATKISLAGRFTPFILLFIGFNSFAQGPGCPNVDAGIDVELDCGVTCTELTATFLDTGETDTYEVSSIPFDPPFPFTGGTPVSVSTDDVWSASIPLPFEFCFFGENQTEFLIGSNGVVTFDTVGNSPGGFCPWSFSASVPSPSLISEAIFGAYMDIDPSVGGSGNINFAFFGEAPCRTLVVNFPDIPYFSCNAQSMTSQIVIYETTNVVEVYMQERTSGCTWNSGNAVIGIQNISGTSGFTPPARNTGDWSATEEAWRFTPSGESNVDFVWLDGDGVEIGTTPTIEVCPTEATTYTAQATYTLCNGDVIVETDPVTVTLGGGSVTLDLGEDQSFCDVESFEIIPEITGADPGDLTYLWSTGETTPTITVTETGTYSLEVTLDTCTVEDAVFIEFNESPIIDLGADFTTCFENAIVLDASPSNYTVEEVTFEWLFNGVVLPDVTPTIEVSEFGIYTARVAFEQCLSEDSIEITSASDINVDLGSDIQSCLENPIVLDATPTNYPVDIAAFEWFLDGVSLNETTATIEAIAHGTYTVEVTVGLCSTEDSILISPREDLEVTLSGETTGCTLENKTLTATTSENDVTFSWFLNGNIIEGETSSSLEITLPNTVSNLPDVYSVEITKGFCSATAEIEVRALNCVISQGLSPDGSIGFNDNLDLEFLANRTGIANLQILNRHGREVYRLDNYVNQWVGQTDDGDELPTGTYFYVISFAGEDPVYGKQKTGWIYINRESN